MAEESTGSEDDWVKQMLAEAMLGRSALPTAEPAPVAERPVEASTAEPLTEPVEAEVIAVDETVVVEEAAAVDEALAGEDAGVVEERTPVPEPLIRYQVVLDDPAPIAPVPDDVTAEASAEAPVTEPAPTNASPIRYQVVLDEPAAPAPVPTEPVPTEPVAVKPVVYIAETADEPAGQGPAPASASRLFERPNFDATNDPGVDEMLAEERPQFVELEESGERSRLRGTLEWLAVLGSAVVVALLLRAFLFQAFFIPSESMEATLRVDDRVLVNKLSYRFGDVERGEVVVFRRPDDQPGEFRDLIKRVIGLPGESIEARDNTIFIDGQVLIEPYLTPGEVIGDFGPSVIPDGEYFMMGDNRDNSGDSRVFGTVDGDRFIGRAFFLFWPLDRIGSL